MPIRTYTGLNVDINQQMHLKDMGYSVLTVFGLTIGIRCQKKH
jgi:hypothetical protein